MTKNEFFKKMDWEGSFEGMASYMGYKPIIDDPDMDSAWKAFVAAFEDLQATLEEWEALEGYDDD